LIHIVKKTGEKKEQRETHEFRAPYGAIAQRRKQRHAKDYGRGRIHHRPFIASGTATSELETEYRTV